jgi:hypothetical protein
MNHPKKTPAQPAAKGKTVATFRHDAKRKNLPTAEYESLMRQEDMSPIAVAYERRNRDLDPQLVWRGKDDQDWSELVERLAADRWAEFPDMRGFSANNLRSMRQIYSEYSVATLREQLVQELKRGGRQFLEQAVPGIIAPAAATPAGVILEQPVQESVATIASVRNAEILAQHVRELLAAVPWGHHVELLNKPN